MDKKDPSEKTILIIEDDPAIVEFFKFILEKEGFHTCSVGDARGISSIVKKENPDLIISDLMMPYMGGYEGIRELQRETETKNIPIFIVTAKLVDESTKSMLKMEPNVLEVFSKPVQKAEFLSIVHKQLNTISSDEKIIEDFRKNVPDWNKNE